MQTRFSYKKHATDTLAENIFLTLQKPSNRWHLWLLLHSLLMVQRFSLPENAAKEKVFNGPSSTEKKVKSVAQDE